MNGVSFLVVNVNRNEVFKLVCEYADLFGPTNRPERKSLEKQLRAASNVELFEGLYMVFLLQDDEFCYARQQNAGVILFKFKPRVHLEIGERIRMCLPTWNVSVEELPFYFLEKCGLDRVSRAIELLEAEPLTERERSGLTSITYWLNKHES